MTGREQRLVFGEVAEAYDRARPGYPAGVVTAVLDFAEPPPDGRVLEVGAGTGKATVPFAATGLSLLALEPDPAMAAVAARNCAAHPNVTIVTATFEDWPVERSAFDIVLSAQAWHWVPSAMGYATAHQALEPGAALALVWNQPQPEEALTAVYRRIAPDLADTGAWRAYEREIAESGWFHPATVLTFPWTQRYPTDRYIELLTTHSPHRLLPADRRNRLLEAIAAVIDGAGGELVVEYVTRVYLARPYSPQPSPADRLSMTPESVRSET